MAVWDLLVASARRWYVVLAGLVLTVGVLLLVHQTPGVYATQTNVVFLAPVTPHTPNTISSPTSGVISTAGLVERIVNKGVEKSPTSGSVALAGQGVDDGYSVELPNAGGQWASNFNRPVLQVQVTGPSAERVRSELQVDDNSSEPPTSSMAAASSCDDRATLPSSSIRLVSAETPAWIFDSLACCA